MFVVSHPTPAVDCRQTSGASAAAYVADYFAWQSEPSLRCGPWGAATWRGATLDFVRLARNARPCEVPRTRSCNLGCISTAAAVEMQPSVEMQPILHSAHRM